MITLDQIYSLFQLQQLAVIQKCSNTADTKLLATVLVWFSSDTEWTDARTSDTERIEYI